MPEPSANHASVPLQRSLRQPLPDAVAAALRQAEGDPAALQLHTASDIDLFGNYSPQWVLADATHVWVIAQSQPEKPVHRLTMAEITEFRTVAVVGSGLLQAKVGHIWLDLTRFSNRRKHLFNRLARRLEDLRKDGQVELTEEDSHDPRQCQTCGLLLQYPGETCPRCVNRGAALSRLIQLMKPYKGAAITMMVLLLLGIALDMVGPLLTRYLVDHVLQIGQQPPEATAMEAPATAGRFHLLMVVVAALAGVQVTRAFITTLNGRVASTVGTSITFDIRGRLVAHLQKLGLSFYDKQQVGSLVGRVAYDTEALQLFMSQLTSGFLMQILMVVFSLLLMITLAPTLAMWTLLPAPFVIVGMIFFYRYIYPRYHRFYDRSSKQAGQLSGMLSGIRVVKAFAQEDQELTRFMDTSAKLRDARRGVDASAATFYPLMGILFQVGGWLVWYIGGGRVLNEELSLGTLMAFFGYLAMFYGPLASLTALTTWLTQFTTQLHRIFEVLDTPVGIQEADDAVARPQLEGDVEFKDVVFSYSRQTPVVKGMSFRINAGESIGVVGRSGCGKSTLINLIARFYDIDEGQVLIDHVDVRKLRLTDLRQQMSMVLQEPFLFRGTIWSNLSYAHADATPQQVIAATRAANGHDFVMKQYHGYDTWVGERGAGLSGGERQRLSIARALMGDPRILIFDEATSALDSESEQAIQAAMAEMVKGRTTILIAHRLSTLRLCDRIIVVDDGKVAEQGTHDELMALDGHYAKLFNLQAGPGGTTESIEQTPPPETAQQDVGQTTEPTTPVRPEPVEDEANDAPALPAIDGYRPRWLTPHNAAIHLGNLNALHVTVKGERIYPGVFALRCLPVRHPNRYLSLRYTDAAGREQEVGLIDNLADWPADAQEHVKQALLRRYFVHTVERIHSIEAFQNFLAFKVTTDLGPMDFIMRSSSDSAHDYGEGGKMLLDLEENRYLIPDLQALPPGDRKLFQRFIYW